MMIESEFKRIAWQLMEDLHEPFSNEARMDIIVPILGQMYRAGLEDGVQALKISVNRSVPHEV